MLPVLIHVRPLDLKTGLRVDIRASSAGDATASGLGGQFWEPAVQRRPRIAQDLMSMDLDGKFKLAAADTVLDLKRIQSHPQPSRLYWPGAPITIYSVAQLDWNRRVIEFMGSVSSSPYDRDGKALTLNGTVDRDRIDKPLLFKEFNADGAAGGGPEMRGKPMPAGFGFNENIEWTLFDTVNNIGMLDGYGNLIGVTKAMEGLNDLGPSVGDWPTYGQLKDAINAGSIVKGRWGTSLAQGMVALGAPPAGRITFNAAFGSTRTGAIIKRMLKLHAVVADEEVMLGTFDILDAAANMEVRAYWRDQVQVSDCIESMCQPLNATPLVTAQNRIAVTLATTTPPVATLNYDASTLPLVTNARTADPIVPIWRLVYRAERPVDVLGYSEVNYVDVLVDRGLFSIEETYRQGNLVWLADKSQWLYINGTPAEGHTPGDPQDNAADGTPLYWQQILAPTDTTTLYYPSGRSVAEMEPAQPRADVTGDNTSKDTAAVWGRAAASVIKGMDVNTDAILSAVLNGDELNQLIQAMAAVEGQPVSVKFLEFRGQQTGINDAQAYKVSLLGAMAPDGTGFILDMNRVLVQPGKSLATRLNEISATSGGVSASVQLLFDALVNNGSAYSKAILRTDADGVFGAFSITADGVTRLSRISMVADELEFVDRNNGGAPIKALHYADGNWQLADNLYVRALLADTVYTRHIVGSAVQQTKFTLLRSDVSIPRGQTSTIGAVNFVKDEPDSLLEMSISGQFWSPDDLQFTVSFVVDGGVSYSGGAINIVLDVQNSQGKAQQSPFYVLENLPAGPHSVTVNCYNNETDNVALTIKAGSLIKVIELKKGAV